MEYREFFERFGGSCRIKHIPRPAPWPQRLKQKIQPEQADLPNPLKGASYDGRTYLPPRSEAPIGFIQLDPWEAEYLFILASRAKKGIVEVGRMYGGSTFLLACGNNKVPIYSIDIAPKDDERLLRQIEQHGLHAKVELIVGDSQKTKYPQIGEVDLLFIDGDHSYEGCLSDLENWYGNVSTGGHVVLHDCYFGCETQDATIDFIERHNVEVVQSPYILSTHWRHPCGSMAHFIKRD